MTDTLRTLLDTAHIVVLTNDHRSGSDHERAVNQLQELLNKIDPNLIRRAMS